MGLLPLHDSVVYGPVRSRRLGISLGVNVLPPGKKICNFNCAYCQYGWSCAGEAPVDGWPPPSAVARILGTRLNELAHGGTRVDRITLAGHGEPTLHPHFREIAAALVAVRDRLAPTAALAVLSNASMLDRTDVRAGLASLDERYLKLDAGDDRTLKTLNGSPVPIARLIAGLRTMPGFVLQSMFVGDPTGRLDNSGPEPVAAWLHAVAAVRPLAVQIYTLDRAPAWQGLRPVGIERLERIAAQVRRIGVVADVY
jgi:wyosine [tRNA(Phe)-imidazoG37] synthetase (radical SAM superfamily)